MHTCTHTYMQSQPTPTLTCGSTPWRLPTHRVIQTSTLATTTKCKSSRGQSNLPLGGDAWHPPQQVRHLPVNWCKHHQNLTVCVLLRVCASPPCLWMCELTKQTAKCKLHFFPISFGLRLRHPTWKSNPQKLGAHVCAVRVSVCEYVSDVCACPVCCKPTQTIRTGLCVYTHAHIHTHFGGIVIATLNESPVPASAYPLCPPTHTRSKYFARLKRTQWNPTYTHRDTPQNQIKRLRNAN